MPENKTKSEIQKNRREQTQDGSRKEPREKRITSLLPGVRSISTPPGEPYNDVLLRRQ